MNTSPALFHPAATVSTVELAAVCKVLKKTHRHGAWMRAADGLVTFRAFTFEGVRLSVTIPAGEPAGRFEGRIDPSRLAALLPPKKAGIEAVTLRSTAPGLLEVWMGSAGAKLALEDVKEPDPGTLPPGGLAAEFNVDALARGLAYLEPAICTDETRPQLGVIAFRDGEMIATDGHRGHKAPGPSFGSEEVSLKAEGAQVLRAALEALRPAGDVRIYRRGEGWLSFAFGTAIQVHIDAPREDKDFPMFHQVVPREEDQIAIFTADAGALRGVLEQARRLVEDPKRAIVSTVLRRPPSLPKGRAELLVQTNAGNPAGPAVPVTLVQAKQRDQRIFEQVGLFVAYALDALRGIKGEIRIGQTGPLDPVTIRADGGLFALIMPTRL